MTAETDPCTPSQQTLDGRHVAEPMHPRNHLANRVQQSPEWALDALDSAAQSWSGPCTQLSLCQRSSAEHFGWTAQPSVHLPASRCVGSDDPVRNQSAERW